MGKEASFAPGWLGTTGYSCEAEKRELSKRWPLNGLPIIKLVNDDCHTSLPTVVTGRRNFSSHLRSDRDTSKLSRFAPSTTPLQQSFPRFTLQRTKPDLPS
ncbi:unnamed protein product [Penicillium pancosmium]